MNRVKWISLGVLIVACLVALFTSLNRDNEPQVLPKKVLPTTTSMPRRVYVGAWAGGFWDSSTKTLDVSALSTFEKNVNKKMAIANMFSEWGYLANPELLEDLNQISDQGWVPMISSNPHFFDGCSERKDNLYKEIASGRCDEFLASAAANLKAYKKPVLLRFAWEMNLPSMYWGVEKVKSTPKDFIASWRHFYDVLDKEGADNVVWVLSFNTSSGETIPYKDLYPGDKYVDWVAIDGYNWGVGKPWGGWTDFNGVFRNSYNELVAVSDKPVMLSEVNSATNGGNKALWLRDMLNVQVPEKFPKVEAIIFFNENKSEGESVDWRLEKSEEFLMEVRKGLANNMYRSTFP